MNGTKKGLLFVILAQIIWGIMPIYWKYTVFVNSIAMIAHRIIWSFVFMLLLLVVIRQWRTFLARLKEPAQLRFSVPGAVMIVLNWFIYVYAIQKGEILQTTLGYYVCPLILAFIGWTFFGEKPRKAQYVAVVLSTIGVVLQTLAIDKIPYYAFAVALTFATYSAIKKSTPYDSVFSMGYETFFLLPLAIMTLFFARTGNWELTKEVSTSTYLILVLAGPMTVLPLLLHAHGLRAAPLSVTAFIQYLSPTMAMFLGILVYGEVFDTQRQVAFSFSWLALIIFAVDQWRYLKRVSQQTDN